MNDLYKIPLVLFLLSIFICCNDNDTTSEISYCRFTAAELTLGPKLEKGAITVEWNLSEWEIITDTNGFISDFSLMNGGSFNNTGLTTITFNYSDNPFADLSRQQDIFVIDKVGASTGKITIIQKPSEELKITVDTKIKYQTVTGFGGMNNPPT